MARTLDAKYQNLNEMRAAGFTDEDIRAIIDGPRSTEATWADDYSSFTWPKVNGFVVCGTSLLNEEEKKAYNNYKKYKAGARGLSSGSSTSSATKEMWQSCLDTVIATGNQTLVDQFMKLMPKQHVSLLFQMFGVNDVGAVKKCTVHWLMFRGPNGERAEKHMLKAEDLGPLFVQGWMPVYTLQEIKDNLAKLKQQGIDLDKVVQF